MNCPPDWLLVFARYPESGRAKTRLIPALGAERAAQLQSALTRRTLDVVRQLVAVRPCHCEVRFAGGDVAGMRRLFGDEYPYEVQHGNDLGQRLEYAVAAAFQAGARRVVVIGTDCPELDDGVLGEAFDALAHADVVLGPALDGGYYLLGLTALRPAVFRGIDWGSEQVLAQTLKRTADEPCRVRQMRPLPDVDYPEDLLVCRRQSGHFSGVLPEARPGWLSIVIPTLNEERNLAATVRHLVGLPELEVIVADGGSSDATVEIARHCGVAVVPVRRGRGRQMNAGAAMACGEALLFLHADTELPTGFREHVWSTLERGAIAGAFRLRIRDQRTSLRWVEWGANLRSRYLQLPYGDQALFLRSERFFQEGGFPVWPLMEDYEFCRRLRRRGAILLAPAAVSTSARRWQRLGWWRTTLINQLCLAGFRLGVAPDRLARWYTTLR